MGIPLFFKKLCEDYPESIIKNIDFTKNNYLFLDLNCAIHPCCRKITELDYNPLKKDIYEENTRHTISLIYYILGMGFMGYYIIKLLKK